MVIKRFTKLFSLIITLIILINPLVLAKNPTYYVKNYTSFYNSIYSAITKKQPAITLYIYQYSSRKYPLTNAIFGAEAKNKNIKFIISSYTVKSYKSGNYTKFNINFSYKTGDVCVNSLSEFKNTIYNAVSSKKQRIKIIVNNYSSLYNLNSLDDSKTSNAIFSSNIYKMSKSKKALIDLSISYTEPKVNDGSSGNTNVALTYDEIKEKIISAINNTEEKVTFVFNNPQEIDMQSLSSKLEGIYDENPNSYYIKGYNIQQTTQTMNGVPVSRTIEVVFTYINDASTVSDMKNQVSNKVKTIVGQIINPAMTETEKVRAIHDYVVNNTRYDYQNYLNNTIPYESYTAYGVLINNVGVCQGYSHAMYLLLKEAGIENIIISGYGKGEPHAWNLVKIDGRYYHVDATFDDPIVNGGSKQTLRYDYFKLTDSQISSDHSWNTSKYPASN